MELEPVAARFRRAQWDYAYGSSGTLRAVGDVLKAHDPARQTFRTRITIGTAAYLLRHADMPGFPHQEQQLLASIVGSHRRKLQLTMLDELMPPWHAMAFYLIVLLRLAVLLHRGRGQRSLPEIQLTAKGTQLELVFSRGWLAEHPLTEADLEQEVEWLANAGFTLRVA